MLAHRLARYGIGDTLFDVAASLSGTDLTPLSDYLPVWRARLRQSLRDDPEGHLHRRHPALALEVSDTFPDINVVMAYTHPITSPLPFDILYHFTLNKPRPDYVRLGQLCEAYFSWGTPFGITMTFENLIWPGVFLREMITDHLRCAWEDLPTDITVSVQFHDL